MYVQGPGCHKCFPVTPPTAVTIPPQEDPTPSGIPTPWHCHHAPVPPSTPNAMQGLQPRTGVCLPNTWKAYLTGTVMQTSEIMDQLCPKKSGSACWQYDPGYRVNSPLDPHLYQVLNATHHLLNDTNPRWPGIAGFAHPRELHGTWLCPYH